MFDEIRPEGSFVTSEEDRAKKREYQKAAKEAKRALRAANGDGFPDKPFTPKSYSPGRPKSIVNRVTEYGALFNQLNEAHVAKGFAPLKTAMEVLIEAMQSEELDIKEKARIAEKLATFESSRAPIISIEHVQNLTKDETIDADTALNDFMASLKKV